MMNRAVLDELLYNTCTENLEARDSGLTMGLEVLLKFVEFFGKGEGAFVNNASGRCSASSQFCFSRCSPFLKLLHSGLDMVGIRFELNLNPFNFLINPCVDNVLGSINISEEIV